MPLRSQTNEAINYSIRLIQKQIPNVWKLALLTGRVWMFSIAGILMLLMFHRDQFEYEINLAWPSGSLDLNADHGGVVSGFGNPSFRPWQFEHYDNTQNAIQMGVFKAGDRIGRMNDVGLWDYSSGGFYYSDRDDVYSPPVRIGIRYPAALIVSVFGCVICQYLLIRNRRKPSTDSLP